MRVCVGGRGCVRVASVRVCVLWCQPNAVWSNSSWQAGSRPLSRVLCVFCMCLCPALVVCANWKLCGTCSRSSAVSHVHSHTHAHAHAHTKSAQQWGDPLAFLHLTWVQSAASYLFIRLHVLLSHFSPALTCNDSCAMANGDLSHPSVSLDVRRKCHQRAVPAFYLFFLDEERREKSVQDQ